MQLLSSPVRSRRRLILIVLALVVLAACGDTAATTTAPDTATTDAAGEAPLKVAVLTPGLTNDGGFNWWAYRAITRLEEEGLVEATIREQLADPSVAEPTAREFAATGYDLVIGHGIELGEPVLTVAPDFADVHFTVSGGADILERPTDNVEAWTYDFFQNGYLLGFVAGHVEDIDRVGVVFPEQFPFREATLEGFRRGLASVAPDVTVDVVWTGSAQDAQAASEAARSLIAAGADILLVDSNVASPVANVAAEAGVFTLGAAGAGEIAKRVDITSIQLDMYPTFRGYVDRVRSGDFGNLGHISGIANGGLVIVPLEAGVQTDRVPEDLSERIEQLAEDLANGTITLETP